MPTPSKIYYGSTLIYEGGATGILLPQHVERSARVSVTASGSTNTKGSWTELIASTDAAATWVYVKPVLPAANTVDTSCLLDIGIGAGGSETVLIADIACGFHIASTPGFLFPISVASGTRISARIQSGSASRVATVGVSVLTDSSTAMSSIDTIGATTASSRGTAIAASGTYSQITASTAHDYKAIIATVTSPSAASMSGDSDVLLTVGKGGSGSETTVGTFTFSTTTSEQIWVEAPSWFPVFIGDIPAGTRLAVKQSSTRTNFDTVLYGVRA